MVTACPTVKLGSNDSPGFNAWNDDPGAADGVMCTPVGMKVPFLIPSSSAFAETAAPMLMVLEIASASVDTTTHGRRVRPFGNMCYLLFALQFSGVFVEWTLCNSSSQRVWLRSIKLGGLCFRGFFRK